MRTFLRPEDPGARLLYALVANVAIGLGATTFVLRAAIRRGLTTAGAIDRLGGGSPSWRILAWLAAAAAFAVYHFAHSPPFNTLGMVGLLSVVGLVTGGFYFMMRELYGTIVFHNFLALQGVTRALAESGRLEAAASPQAPLLVTALVVTTLLILLDRIWVRRSPKGARSEST